MTLSLNNSNNDFVGWVIKTSWLTYFRSVKFHYGKHYGKKGKNLSCRPPVRWQLITFPVSTARWRQQTDQLGRSAHHFPLFWQSYFNFLPSLLWVPRAILWVNAIFVYKFDSFSKSVLSSHWPKFPPLSPIITPRANISKLAQISFKLSRMRKNDKIECSRVFIW